MRVVPSGSPRAVRRDSCASARVLVLIPAAALFAVGFRCGLTGQSGSCAGDARERSGRLEHVRDYVKPSFTTYCHSRSAEDHRASPAIAASTEWFNQIQTGGCACVPSRIHVRHRSGGSAPSRWLLGQQRG